MTPVRRFVEVRRGRPGAMSDHADDLLTLDQAADALGVDSAQAAAMVDQELLIPTEGTGADPRFTRAAVEAVRLAGG